MKIYHLIAGVGIILLFVTCSGKKVSFPLVNSVSFSEDQILPEGSVAQKIRTDSASIQIHSGNLSEKTDEMFLLVNDFRKSPSDSIWNILMLNWNDFSLEIKDVKVTEFTVSSLQKWAELNIQLLKISGEVKFADVLDRLFYQESAPVMTEKLLKSFAYTHVEDQIFINFIGSSSLLHHHTTGGDIKLIQVTAYPLSDEMILNCESDDTRFLDVFIRIPLWAVNPTVNHGNVKYVARPGEYCEISRKWKNGDEIVVRLKN